MPTSGQPCWTNSDARRELIVAAIVAAAILAVGVYTSFQKPETASFRSYPPAMAVALPSSAYIPKVDAANNKSSLSADGPRPAGAVGQRSIPRYRWRNSVTGEVKITSNPTRPGPAWASY